MANTTNLDLVKPLGTDHALVAQINSNSDKIDAEAGRTRANFAAEYSASSAYAVGAFCTHNGILYQCNTAIGSGGEAWTSGHWTQISAGDAIVANNQAIVGIRTHEAISSSASDWDTAIENYADSLSNDGKCHIGFVQRPQAGIVMCIIQKFADVNYASAVAYGYWRTPRFYFKDSGTWTVKEFALNSTKISVAQRITTSTTLTCTDVSVTIPAGKEFAILAKATYLNNEPLEIALSTSNSAIRSYNTVARSDNRTSISFAGYTDPDYIGSLTLYVWARYASSGQNDIDISGYYR